ncbi:outer membrane transport energization protein ExbD [Sphaerotilus hippei]|uniref:Outer membrane transport energization protein ExbD n=1 Tax=Sphaerotilus hippei TaxID=744406 RepID=A0A318H2Z6_9BURK|nr:biopolymer transporter ExbD [Sphaerotilus hippei]PXW95249.1 outer membrane transport energization protein ExbD [Sphaerotilus hippei]
MGMNLGPGAHAEGDDPEPMMDINTTPLIDVMLVLLVMLIITIPIQLHSVELQMPVGTPPPVRVEPEVVRIDIEADDTIRWQGEAVADRAELVRRLAEAAARPVPPEVHLRPDRAARYDTFVTVMIAAREQGLRKLGVIGSDSSTGR